MKKILPLLPHRIILTLVFFLLSGAPTFAASPDDSKGESVKRLVETARTAKGKERGDAVDNLENVHPETEGQINVLVATAHGKDLDLQEAATKALRNVSPDARHLSKAYVSLLDDDSEKVQVAAIHGCGKLGAREAAPKILHLLSKSPRSKFTAANLPWMTMEHMAYVDEAAEVLVNFQYDPALDEILSRDELMVNVGFGGPLVAKYGAKALPKFLELIHKNDKRKLGGLVAIVNLRDEAAVPDLITLLDDPDHELAGSAAHALSDMPVKSAVNGGLVKDALRKQIRHPSRFVRGYAYSGLIRVDPNGSLPMAMEALRRDPVVRLDILYALIKNPVKEAVPYLKNYIVDDETKEPNDTTGRAVAAQAIFKTTGEKVPYKGLESELKRYEQGRIPDPYDPYGKDGAHFKKKTYERP
jgi:HEAT repeat protein